MKTYPEKQVPFYDTKFTLPKPKKRPNLIRRENISAAPSPLAKSCGDAITVLIPSCCIQIFPTLFYGASGALGAKACLPIIASNIGLTSASSAAVIGLTGSAICFPVSIAVGKYATSIFFDGTRQDFREATQLPLKKFACSSAFLITCGAPVFAVGNAILGFPDPTNQIIGIGALGSCAFGSALTLCATLVAVGAFCGQGIQSCCCVTDTPITTEKKAPKKHIIDNADINIDFTLERVQPVIKHQSRVYKPAHQDIRDKKIKKPKRPSSAPPSSGRQTSHTPYRYSRDI